MAYENLKTAIEQAIKQNGNQEITGPTMQSTLFNIVNTLGADYKFLGFATPSTVPPTSEQGNLFYFAIKPGNYSNFKTNTGNLVITIENGVFFFTKNATDSYWNSNKVFEIVQAIGEAEDKVMSQKATSTELNKKFDKNSIAQESGDSEELVMSQKAVSDKLKELSTKQEIIYDVSARNDSAVFESLQALLSSPNLDTLIPMSFRHGGMSISFIQSSDNKYVQYRLTSDTFDITVANWERYNDVTASNQSFSDLDISDENGNVIVRYAGGHLQVKNFSSADILESIQAILSNIGFDNVPEFSEEKDYAVGEIVRYKKYVYVFTSEHTAGAWDVSEVEKTVINTEHPIEVFNGVSKADLDIVDEQGNVLARFANGHIQVKNFDSSKKGYLPRPSNGIINFSVNVDCYIADNNSNTLNNQDIPQNEQSTYIKQDWGVLMLLKNYKQEGEAVYLVVCCHGTGTWISSNATQVNGKTDNMFLGMGFAIMDMNGCPDATSNTDRGYGTPPSLRAYLAGIQYVIQNYNIRKEIFVYGVSMGGLASTFIAEVYPNVIAQGAFCPCLDIVREAYMTPWNGTTQKDRICTKFGFIGEKPTFSANRPISQEEKTYLISNIDKIIGYNNMWRGTIGLNFENCITVDAPSTVTSETSDEIALYNNVTKIRNVPLKIWHNTDDPTVPFKYSKYFVEMCRRGGCLVELRSFPSGGHNAWQNGEKVNVTTKYKGTLEVYTSEYELLLWFLKFINN